MNAPRVVLTLQKYLNYQVASDRDNRTFCIDAESYELFLSLIAIAFYFGYG